MTNSITTDGLRQLRRSNTDFLLLDVLPKARFDRGHIDGARNVPLDAPGFLASVQHAAGSKGRRIVVYCGGDACDSSLRVAAMLSEDGFDDVTTYEGGLAAWQEPGDGLAQAAREIERNEAVSLGAVSSRSTPIASAYVGDVTARYEQVMPTPQGTPAPVLPSPANVVALRERARRKLDDGAVTASYSANRATVVAMLNAALATEIVCVLRYKRHQFMAQGIHARKVAAEFFEHAAEEQGHADLIADRIVQLGGEPDFSPDGLSACSHAVFRPGTDLASMIKETLVAERIAIESYSAMVRYLGDADPTTRRMIEQLLATEEKHAAEMARLLRRIGNSEHD